MSIYSKAAIGSVWYDSVLYNGKDRTYLHDVIPIIILYKNYVTEDGFLFFNELPFSIIIVLI